MKDHIFNIHDVILLMTVAECILLALFQAVLPIKNRWYGYLLSAFLLIVATSAATTLILWNVEVRANPTFEHYWLPYFLMVSQMLKGPVLFLYIASVTRHTFRLQMRQAVHLIPAAISVLVMLIFGVTAEDLRLQTPEDTHSRVAIHLWDAAKLVPLVYASLSVVLVQRYHAQLKNEYSHFSRIEPGWLNVMTLGFFISWAWTALVHITAKFSSEQLADMLGIADNYITFVLINALFIYTLAYAHQLLATSPEPEVITETEKPSDLAIDRVRHAMDEDKLYLKQNLNIEQFSTTIDLPVKEVSAVINKHFGTNFFEFVNSYRVNEAKQMLSDPSLMDKTILDILLESGFNSKSAFHRFFKRLVGSSPTEFRKEMLEKNSTT